MKPIRAGQPFPYRTLSVEERAGIQTELEWLEGDLRRRRDKLRFWARHRQHAAEDPDYPEDLRKGVEKYHAQAEDLVASGERLRGYLLLQLKDQPEYAPAYHYAH